MSAQSFNITLGQLMSQQRCTIPHLAWRTGISERSIQNWLAGRQPRYWQPVIKIARALEASESVTNHLLESAGKLSLSQLKQRAVEPDEIGLLGFWAGVFFVPPIVQPFIGRKQLIDDIYARLSAENSSRYCLLQGMAGVGKTVIAKQIAHTYQNAFPDGVLWIELPEQESEPLHTHFYHLCIACGIGDEAAPLPLLKQRFHNWLSERRVLLILDNVQSGQQIDQFYVAINRESKPPLQSILMMAQHGSLRLPHQTTIIQIMPFNTQNDETLQLFAQYLGEQRVQNEQDAFIEIANLIGHLPLAATIVARRLATDPSWSATEFLEDELRLEHSRMEALQYDDLNVRVSFNITYQRLSSAQQRYFTELGVFGGRPFDLDAAGAILNLSSRMVKKLLRQFTQLALLEKIPPSHYQLHPLLSQYAQDFLAGKDIYSRKIRYYIQYAQTHQYDPRALYQEMGNIEQALHDAYEQRLDTLFVQGIDCTHLFLSGYNLHSEMFEKVEKALEMARKQQNMSRIASLLAGLAYLNLRRNRSEVAENQLNEAHKIAQIVQDNSAVRIKILKIQGGLMRHDAIQAQTLWQEALTLAEQNNNHSEVVKLHYNLANLEWGEGRLEHAMAHIERAQPLLASVNSRLQSLMLSMQGVVQCLEGALVSAENSFSQALKLARSLNNPSDLAILFHRYGRLARLQNDYDKAQIFFEQGIEKAIIAEMTAAHANLLCRQAEIWRLKKQYQKAQNVLQKGFSLAQTVTNLTPQAYLLLEKAYLTVILETDPYTAMPHLEESLAIATKLNNIELIIEIHLCCEHIYVLAGASIKADNEWATIHAIATKTGYSLKELKRRSTELVRGRTG